MTPQELREKVMAGFTEKLRSADNDSIVDYEACLMDAAINLVLDAAAEVARHAGCQIRNVEDAKRNTNLVVAGQSIALAILSLKTKKD